MFNPDNVSKAIINHPYKLMRFIIVMVKIWYGLPFVY